MQKTKLGITVGLTGAAIYFMGLFGGYLVTMLLAGYVLLFEENEWLKKSAVKAVALMVFFSVLVTGINLLPNTISFINNVFSIIGGSFGISIISKLVTVLVSGIDIIEKLLFIGLGLKALNQGTISVPVVDKLVSKYM